MVATTTTDQSQQSSISNFIFQNAAQVPPQVLFAWLGYLHELTGEWLMPPSPAPAQAAANSYSPTASHTQTLPTLAPSVEGGAARASANASAAAMQMPFPTMLPYAPIAPVVEVKAARYDYAASPYFQEAARLIRESPRPELGFPCTVVLAFILAWCNFPLFREMSGREGKWMALSALRCAREVRMRLAQFNLCIGALQGAGILEVGNIRTQVIPRDEFDRLRYDCGLLGKDLGGGSYWKTRSIQEKNTIYKLRKNVGNGLPPFNPFTKAAHSSDSRVGYDFGKDVGKTWESLDNTSRIPGNDLNRGGNGLDTLKSASESLGGINQVISSDSGSAPEVPCINDSDVDVVVEDMNMASIFKNQSSIKRLQDKIGRLNPTQKTKFDFLTIEAAFEGFETEDGRTTIDPQAAIEFAVRRDYTIEKLKERHGQVNERWLAGESESPLGLLYWSLKRDKDPRRASPDKQFTDFVERVNRQANPDASVLGRNNTNGSGSHQHQQREQQQRQRRTAVAGNGTRTPAPGAIIGPKWPEPGAVRPAGDGGEHWIDERGNPHYRTADEVKARLEAARKEQP